VRLSVSTAVLAATLSALAAAAIPSPARAADVEILTPRADALVTSGKVTVRVRTSARMGAPRTYVRGRGFREISGRFGRARHGVRSATLRFGRELVAGQNHLFVQARRRAGGRVVTKVVRFTVGRPARGFLRVTVSRGSGRRGPLSVRARAPRADTLRVTLNGRPVAREFKRDRRGAWRATLAADNGLRFGPNRLTVTAFNDGGRYRRIRHMFRIRRTGPLISAGRPRTVRRDNVLRLDGRATRAAHRGDRVRLRWRIVKRPRGSKAKLRWAGRPRPRLRPDVSGRYAVRVSATELRGRAGAAKASSSDTVSVTAQPNFPPSGIPISTLVGDTTPGVAVAGQLYPLGTGWLQMLVLDRAAPDSPPLANNAYQPSDGGMAQLASDVNNLSDDELAVLSAGGQPVDLSSKASNSLVSAVRNLGGVLLPGTGSPADLETGQWSLIGVQGLPQGQAQQLIGLRSDPNAPVGSMTGFLQQDVKQNYVFTWPPSYVPFDTQAPGSTATQNVISVGAQQYPSDQIASNQTGFHVVWLDAGTLALRDQITVTAPACGLGEFCLDALAGWLQPIVDSQDPALLMVGSIGNPAMTPSPSVDARTVATVTQLLASMGAQQFVLLGLDGTGGYSFVGNQGFLQLRGPNSGTELGQTVAGAPSARLTGLLERTDQGSWAAGPNGSPGPGVDPALFQPSLRKVLAQPGRAFPPFDLPGGRQAEQWIFEHLFPGQVMDPTYGIRAKYWSDSSITWSDEANDIDNPTVVPADCPTAACAAALPTVRDILAAEFSDVDMVQQYFTEQLSGILDTAFGEDSLAFTTISTDILHLYNPSGKPNGPDIGAMLGDALTIASGASALVPGGEIPSAGLGMAAGMEGLIDAFATDGGGASELDPTAFEVDVGHWGQQLIDSWNAGKASLDNISDLIVSDRGRLTAAVDAIGTTSGPDSWNLGNGAQLTTTLNRSATQYIWQTMLPVPVQVVDWYCYDNYGQFINPDGVSTTAQFHPKWVTGSAPGFGIGTPYLFPVGPSLRVPDDGTLKALFDRPTASQPDNLGIPKEYFWAGAWMDGSKPVTPGFVYRQPQEDIWEHFAYGVNPPRGCLSSG
jgi:hypothetical protein